MALAPDTATLSVNQTGALSATNLKNFTGSAAGRKLLLMVGVAAVVAVMAAVWLWSQKPEYRVLFSNFSDRDAGAIVSSLQQMNVPYQFAEGGGAILVPADQVYDARVKLAAQGLPKGGNVGFELMENQKLGVSQFLEQVNFQRALEGELARSIEAVSAVHRARIHLALPKSSVFVRERQKPTASVLLHLNPGRTLDALQVSAIVHLVASSVPELTAKNVTLVDQNGELLSDQGRDTPATGMDPSQLKYVQEIQQNIAQRIESILTPILGSGNIRAEASADVDFSRMEQAAEIFKPNQTSDSGAVRSLQSSETRSNDAGNVASGVPGALTNQPQPDAIAPIEGGENGAKGSEGAPLNTQKDSTINYEVDKTVRYTQQPMVGVRRLSVAVVVNHKQVTGKNGKVTQVPLSELERQQVTNLVKEAMGYNQERGDTLNVVNSAFVSVVPPDLPDVPLWKDPAMLELAKQIGKYLLAAVVLLYLYYGVLRPMLRRISNPPELLPPPTRENDADDAVVQLSQAAQTPALSMRSYTDNLEVARKMAREDPKVVASVIKNWMNGNE